MTIAGLTFTRSGPDTWDGPDGWRIVLDLDNAAAPWRVQRPGAALSRSRYLTPYIAVLKAKEKWEHARNNGPNSRHP